jgi:hypothetical protein
MAELLSLRKVFDDGSHAAVTDLARWRGETFLAFRHAHRHDTWPPGDIVVLASRDLETWNVRARVATAFDDRDPKLVPDGDRLLLYFGSHHEERDVDDRRIPGRPRLTWSHVTWTDDGARFALPLQACEASYWLWSPKRFGDHFWCAAYGRDATRADPPLEVVLMRSDDGVVWERHATLLANGEGNETALHRFADGRMLAVVRGTGDETLVMEAEPPYTAWSRRTVPHWMHAPAIVEVAGKVVVAGRDRTEAGGYVTRLWELDGARTVPLLDLPSGGDTSYCGLAVDDDATLLVSYYSQHEFEDRPGFRICERPSAIYLARVRLQDDTLV